MARPPEGGGIMVTPLEGEMHEALDLVLRFHRGGRWTETDAMNWKAITGDDESTTKSMCDHIRRVMGKLASQQDVIDCESPEATKHRIAHNDGWHREFVEPDCPACGRIARLEVYKEIGYEKPLFSQRIARLEIYKETEQLARLAQQVDTDDTGGEMT